MDEQELRLKCLEFVTKNGTNYDFPVYQMIEAEMLFYYITEGVLPLKGHSNAYLKSSELLKAALEELKNELPDGNRSTNSSDNNSDKLPIPESFIKRFLSKLRRK